MKILYWILHTFVGCDKHLEYTHKGNKATCKKCGRKFIVFGKY